MAESKLILKNDSFCFNYFGSKESCEDILFITFDGLPGGLKKSGFGTEFLSRNGFDSLHVTCRKNTSYQYLSKEFFGDVVKPVVGGRRAILYGSSVGGYAALYYAATVEGTALAFSPLCPPDPILGGKFKAGSNQDFFHKPLGDGGMVNGKTHFVVYDPCNEQDSVFFEKRVKVGFSNLEVFPVPNGQHSVAKTLRNNNVLKDLFFSVVERGRFPDGLNIDPLKNPTYAAKLSKVLMEEGRISEAADVMRSYLSFGVSKEGVNVLRALFFDHGYDFPGEFLKLSSYRKNKYFRSKRRGMAEDSYKGNFLDFNISIAEYLIDVFDFHAAESLMLLTLSLYPGDVRVVKLLDKIKTYKARCF